MRTIDITTTQNVTIQYELAELRDRFFAFFIDLVIIMAGSMVFSFGILMMSLGSSLAYLTYLLLVPFVVLYTFLSEQLLDGQTIGKRSVSIKVVKLNGKEPTASDHFLRWTFRFLDIWLSCGALAATLVSSSQHAQRLGDLATNTAVIKLQSSRKFSLREILSISSLNDYAPVYPDVRRLTEQDMVLIKSALVRAETHRNPAHTAALIALSQQAAEAIGVSYGNITNPTTFLRTLLKDYIVMTR